jgi:hypothetical protein
MKHQTKLEAAEKLGDFTFQGPLTGGFLTEL